MIWVLIGVVLSYFLHRRLFKIKEETGRETYPNLSAFGLTSLFAIIGWFAHPVFSFVGTVVEAIGNLVGAIPTFGLQVALAARIDLSRVPAGSSGSSMTAAPRPGSPS